MYKEIESKIKNTIFEARTDKNGKVISYRISPATDYKLHEISLDEPIMDENGNETGETKQGFTKSYITAGANYDFAKNDRQIFSIPDTDPEPITE